jgi:hypothetical protein
MMEGAIEFLIAAFPPRDTKSVSQGLRRDVLFS